MGGAEGGLGVGVGGGDGGFGSGGDGVEGMGVETKTSGGGGSLSLKPIFHCNANLLALVLCVGYSPQRQGFVLQIPTCWYLKSLADPTQSLADPTRSLADPTRACNAQRELVEYGLHWVRKSSVCAWHVHFMLFVSISFAFFGGIWALHLKAVCFPPRNMY